MLTVSQAQATIMGDLKPLLAERVSLVEASGRVLAEPITSRWALPHWDNSAMDGYAVRAAEAIEGAQLPISDTIAAGTPASTPLAPGSAARIFTGAPLPPDADTVVMQENTHRTGDVVAFTQSAQLGRHIRRAGSDLAAGDVLLAKGRRITSGDVSALASTGHSRLSVHRRPTVAIISSGDELRDVGSGAPPRGCIINSNGVALAAAVREAGGIPTVYPIVADSMEATLAALEAGARADVLLTSGGVSVGDYDFVGDALRKLSGDAFSFWKVNIKPGKPLAFGRIGACMAFGLPGNPVSALVTFELFVRPALRALQGYPRPFRPIRSAILDAPITAGRVREEYLRASVRIVEGRLHVDASRTQSSAALSSIAGADALIRIRPEAPARATGEHVEVLLLS